MWIIFILFLPLYLSKFSVLIFFRLKRTFGPYVCHRSNFGPLTKKCNFDPLILPCLGKYVFLAPYLYKKVALLAPFLEHVAASQHSWEN